MTKKFEQVATERKQRKQTQEEYFAAHVNDTAEESQNITRPEIAKRKKATKKVQFAITVNEYNAEKLQAFKEVEADPFKKLEQALCQFLDKYEKENQPLTDHEIVFPYGDIENFLNLVKSM